MAVGAGIMAASSPAIAFGVDGILGAGDNYTADFALEATIEGGVGGPYTVEGILVSVRKVIESYE